MVVLIVTIADEVTSVVPAVVVSVVVVAVGFFLKAFVSLVRLHFFSLRYEFLVGYSAVW